MTLRDLKVDRSWTLFLDRDGVINRRIVGDYVKTWDQLGFLPGVVESISRFSGIFGPILVVSNQQGVGKGLMTIQDVNAIHERMVAEIAAGNGRIDAVYFSPHLHSMGSLMRKPNVGMALKARRQFPSIRFSHSLMVGDSITDMIFGKRTGMKTVMISPTNEPARQHPRLIDFICPDLITLSNEL
jgi:histidinol-phosphate phosphatase family protein